MKDENEENWSKHPEWSKHPLTCKTLNFEIFDIFSNKRSKQTFQGCFIKVYITQGLKSHKMRNFQSPKKQGM